MTGISKCWLYSQIIVYSHINNNLNSQYIAKTEFPGGRLEELLKVMHVEDDPSIRLITKMTLEKIGKLTVLSCPDSQTAIAALPDFAPQLILLDVMMPGMDGPATLKAMQQTQTLDGILVLFMTAKVQEKEVEEYLAMGAGGVITKPFEPMNLAGQLREHWAAFQAAST